MAENPYYAGDVISDEKFFVGRWNIVKEIMDSLSLYKVTMIYGQRRIGKSSILSRLEARLKEDNSKYVPVSIDLAGKLGKSVDELAVRFSRVIKRKCKLSNPAVHSGDGAAETFKSSWLPEAINKVLEQNPNGIVLMLDEFDDVSLKVTSPASNFYKYLGEVLRGVSYGLRVVVVLGRDPTLLLDAAQNMLIHAKEFHVSLMSQDEIYSLIDLSKDALNWSEDAKEELWNLTRGHPCISQSICSKIWRTKSPKAVQGKETDVEREDVDRAFSYEDYGHVIDEAWAILLPEEQVVVCFIASQPAWQHEDDILNFIEEMELSDSYNETPLYNFLLKLNNVDWLDRDGNYYAVKVPVYQRWVKEHYPLRDLVNKLYNNNEKAISLALQAQTAKDLPNAITLLERSYKLNPDNEKTLADLTGHFKQFINICLNEGNSKLALKYTERLAKFDLELSLAFKTRVEARVQSNIISQKIESLLREKEFFQATNQARRLGKYNTGRSRFYHGKVAQHQLGFITGQWLTNFLFWFPVSLVAMTLGQGSFPVGNRFLLGPLQVFVIFATFLTALLAAVFDSYKLRVYSYYTTVVFFTFGLAFTVLGLFLVPDIAIPIRVLTAVFLGVAVFIAFSPSEDAIAKTVGATTNLIVLGWLCFFGNALIPGPETAILAPAPEPIAAAVEVKRPPDLVALIWGWLQSIIEYSENH